MSQEARRKSLARLICVVAALSCHLSVSAQSTFQFGPPLNDEWVVKDLCQFGSLPGLWTKDMPSSITFAPSTQNNTLWPGKPNLPYDADEQTADYGNRWVVLDPACRTESLLRPFLDYAKPISVADSFKIVFFSDSLDTHVPQWFGEFHHRRFGAPSEKSIALNYRVRLRDHMALNYAISTSGLNLFHMFLISLDRSNRTAYGGFSLYDPVLRVNVARDQFDAELRTSTGAAEVFQPEMVVLHCNYWALKDKDELVQGHMNNITHAFLLTHEFINSFMTNLTVVATEIRVKFPQSFIVMRTAPMVKHDCVTGGIGGGGRMWAHKMHVAQLNAALRMLAAKLRLPLVDEEQMAGGLTPFQSLFDDIHINEALSMEVINIYLNLHKQYKLALARKALMAVPGGSRWTW